MTNATGPNRILDEFAKLFTDAAGAAQGVRREVETAFRSQAEKFLNSLDVVKREEFEAVREMAAKARAENDLLAARLRLLEERLGGGAASAMPGGLGGAATMSGGLGGAASGGIGAARAEAEPGGVGAFAAGSGLSASSGAAASSETGTPTTGSLASDRPDAAVEGPENI